MRSDWEQAKLNVDRMVKSLETARAESEQARDQVRSSVAALEEAWRAVEGQQEQVAVADRRPAVPGRFAPRRHTPSWCSRRRIIIASRTW